LFDLRNIAPPNTKEETPYRVIPKVSKELFL
jgi:hypothetical protein